MKKSNPNPLFELIKSLTPREKRSFKELANYSQGNDKQYLFLFGIIDKMDEYNENELKSKLKAANITTPLVGFNRYLQDLILKSLRFYHSGKSIDAKIMDYITNATILHNKGLEKLRDKAFSSAKSLAIEHEKTSLLMEILNKEWNCQSRYSSKDVSNCKPVLTDLITLQEYRELSFIKSTLLSNGEIRDDQLQKEWDMLIQNPIMDTSIQRNGFEENYHYHSILTRYFFRVKDFEKSLKHQRQLIEYMESRMNLLQDYKEIYMFELNALIVMYVLKSDFDTALVVIKKMLHIRQWQLTTKEKSTLTDLIPVAYCNIIHSYFVDCFYEQGINLASTTETFIETTQEKNYSNIFVFLILTKVNMYKENYHVALKWNNKILNTPINKNVENFHVFTWIFNLIIHFELKHFDLLESLTRSTTVFLKKRKQLYKTEIVILKYLKNKFPKSDSYRETLTLFKEMKTELEILKKDPYEARAFEYFNYIAWLQSKIENKTMMEVSGKSDGSLVN